MWKRSEAAAAVRPASASAMRNARRAEPTPDQDRITSLPTKVEVAAANLLVDEDKRSLKVKEERSVAEEVSTSQSGAGQQG